KPSHRRRNPMAPPRRTLRDEARGPSGPSRGHSLAGGSTAHAAGLLRVGGALFGRRRLATALRAVASDALWVVSRHGVGPVALSARSGAPCRLSRLWRRGGAADGGGGHRRDRRRQPALAQHRPAGAPTLGADEADDRAGARGL